MGQGRPSDQEFLRIIEATPLVSIDLILRNAAGEILLGWRNNRPARDAWFVPGGRIRKGETLAAAQARISAVETGQRLTDGRLIGAFEHIYEDNAFEAPGIGTHYVTLGIALDWPAGVEPVADSQHQRLRWSALEDLLADPQVHPNTKRFFTADTPLPFHGPAARTMS